MAVRTIIFRPTLSTLSASKLFPTDTDVSNGHLLVSEEIADDDATYVTSSDSTDMLVATGFCFSVNSFEVPAAMRVVCRVKSVNSNSAYFGARMPLKAGTEGTSGGNCVDFQDCSITDSYVDYTLTVPSEQIPALWEYMLSGATDANGVAGAHFIFWGESDDSSSSKDTFEVRMTQLYLEVDYDDEAGGGETEETPLLYLKQDGAWSAVTGTVYTKVNGAWVEGDLSGLSAGDKVVVNEVAT